MRCVCAVRHSLHVDAQARGAERCSPVDTANTCYCFSATLISLCGYSHCVASTALEKNMLHDGSGDAGFQLPNNMDGYESPETCSQFKHCAYRSGIMIEESGLSGDNDRGKRAVY